jgi:hypothetical protein
MFLLNPRRSTHGLSTGTKQDIIRAYALLAPALALALADVVESAPSSLPVPSLGRSHVRRWPRRKVVSQS